MRRWHWFQWISHSVLLLFMGIIVYVIFIAFSRDSGSAGIDMSTIQKVRFDTFTKTALSTE